MIPDFGPTASHAPPLYPSSVYAVPDLDALDAIYGGQSPGFIYARDGHPNGRMLADALTPLEGGRWGVATGSGMAAESAVLLALVGPGDRVVASDRLYGKTTRLLRHDLGKFGVVTDFVDTSDADAVRAALRSGPCRVLYTETLSNPLLRVADLPTLAELAHGVGARLVVDNTFATPVLCRPLELGADVVVESLTKLIGGHSDLTLGFVAGTDPDLGATTASAVSTWGLMAHPFDCWLTLRSLATLDLRARAASASAAVVADWLGNRPGVARVVYPGRPDHPDHALAAKLLPGGRGNMLCFELDGGRDAVNRFLRNTPGVPFCPSLGGATTTCSHPDTTSHRYDPPEEKRRLGITPGLLRLSVGCEPVGRLLGELAKGLPG